jgi:hypothetical protein
MKKKSYPRTRTHTAELVSRGSIHFKCPETPERVSEWATFHLKRAGAPPASERYFLLLEQKNGTPNAQDIAWCDLHARCALESLNKIPEPYLSQAREACVHMFQAGKRHESLDEYQKHAATIHSRQSSNKNLRQTSELSEDRYDRERPKHSKHASLAAALGMTERGLTEWEKRHEKRWSRPPKS